VAYLLDLEHAWLPTRILSEASGCEPIAPAHLERLVVTEQVIKEALRLYPATPVMSRTPLAPEVAGYRLRPGRPDLHSDHRHALLWNDPGCFDLDRIFPEREAILKLTQYMPFGAGRWICLGASFAMTEAKVLLARFIRAARFD
jgi:cytochrome P450